MRKQYHTRAVGAQDHTWDVHRLVRLAQPFPVISVPLTEIDEINELWWFQDKADLPTPRAIAAHMVLVDETDHKYPILLCAEGRLMDGMHRVVKALREGRTMINAVRFPETPDPDFIDVDVNTLPYPDEDI